MKCRIYKMGAECGYNGNIQRKGGKRARVSLRVVPARLKHQLEKITWGMIYITVQTVHGLVCYGSQNMLTTCLTHKKGGVLEGGGLWCALAVDGHSSLESCSFAHIARRQSQVLHVEGAGEEDKKRQSS